MTTTTNRPVGEPTGASQRPSPRPTPHPMNLTHRNSPASSGESRSTQQAPQSPKTGPEVSNLHPQPVALRDRLLGVVATARDYWVPPSLLTESPASITDLSNYAWHGTWTSKTSGPVRQAGIWWHRLISLPTTVACRYTEWIFQRPGRALPVLAMWKLLVSTGPGPWLVAHILDPLLGAIAWVLL